MTRYLFCDVPSGARVHYMASGDDSKPVVLLLHGFPSSSRQYRNLIPLLSKDYRVYAPDLPGFGFSVLPSTFVYTFDNLAKVIEEWIDVLGIKSLVAYIFDYGAPVLERIALARTDLVKGIISQNGNAYLEGLGPAWQALQEWWPTERISAGREKVRSVLSVDLVKPQYVEGAPKDRIDRIDPSSYTMDYLQNIQGKEDIQLDLFFDYQNNLHLYGKFQQWMKEKHLPVLAIWGKNDPWFIPPGAEAFKKHADAKVVLLDGAHFVLETHVAEVAEESLTFLSKLSF